MLDLALNHFPPGIIANDPVSNTLGIADPKMARLLGIATEHSSHLNEIGADNSAPVLRIIESLGNSLISLAVAHSIHLRANPSSPADASCRMATEMTIVYSRLAQALGLSSYGRVGRSVAYTDDFKSRLQQYWQSTKRIQPRYTLLAEEGPEHDKTFLVRVSAGRSSAEGTGRTLKGAEQDAALRFLSQHADGYHLDQRPKPPVGSVLRALVGQVI